MIFDCGAQPDTGVPSHAHDHEDELFIIREGTVRLVVDGREIAASAGDSLFGPRGVRHAWETIGDVPVTMTIVIKPGKLDPMFRDLGALTTLDFGRIASICREHGARFA